MEKEFRIVYPYKDNINLYIQCNNLYVINGGKKKGNSYGISVVECKHLKQKYGLKKIINFTIVKNK